VHSSVQAFYDQFADSYDEIRDLFDMTEVINAFWGCLDMKKGRLLDLGCGAGEPFGRWFVGHGWTVIGVDFSKRMLELAAKYVPQMQTIYADMRRVEFEPDSFDAITATYSLFHVPRKDHAALFEKFYRWLRPRGTMLFTYATKEYTGSDEFDGYVTFMRQEVYYSHTTPEKLYAMLKKTGFRIESKEYRQIGGETFLWVMVKKPVSSRTQQNRFVSREIENKNG
jgi:cyclopropane fatty-acyl-phospholipid synthase-like methyltransferase